MKWSRSKRCGIKRCASPNGEQNSQLYELYQLNDFYIELRGPQDSIGYNNIRTFKTTDLLEPYLDQIKLPEL